jgi:hypothetical protein
VHPERPPVAELHAARGEHRRRAGPRIHRRASGLRGRP